MKICDFEKCEPVVRSTHTGTYLGVQKYRGNAREEIENLVSSSNDELRSSRETTCYAY